LIFILLFNLEYTRVKHFYNLSKNAKYYIVKNGCGFYQKPISECQKQKFLKYLSRLQGIIYKEGGNNPKEGFDCSGLIVYAYNKLGYRWFRDSTFLVNDISADALYRYNVKKIKNINLLKSGDLIFFDTNNDKILEHVSIFIRKDNQNNIWVLDATDYPDGKIVNKVSYRKINNFYNKHPLFGSPLKTMRTISFLDYLNFP
jgi:murein DD-endopeptidase